MEQQPRQKPERARVLKVFRLGRVEYEDGLALQQAFFEARKSGVIGDALLLLEHPPVLTLGRGGKPGNVLAAPELLAAAGIRVHETTRGGDVTYHGPGQVVGYPIIDLAPDRQDVRRYVRDIEETMIRTCADFGVQAHRIDGWNGTWLGDKGAGARKIGAVGVHISRWITTHGFALNVNTDLSHFGFIVPCGITEAGVTSLEKELGARQPADRVQDRLARHLGERLEIPRETGRVNRHTISLVILRDGPSPGSLEALVLLRHPHRGGFWQQVTGTIERGESAAACALRELGEEAGFEAEIRPLHYVHSFLFGEPRSDRPPRIFEETAFWCRVPRGKEPTLDSREHAEFAWVSVEEAIARVPFAGLKEGLRRAVLAASAA